MFLCFFLVIQTASVEVEVRAKFIFDCSYKSNSIPPLVLYNLFSYFPHLFSSSSLICVTSRPSVAASFSASSVDISCFRRELMGHVLIRWQEEMLHSTLTGNEVLFLSNCVSMCQSRHTVPSWPEWVVCLSYWKPTLWSEMKPNPWKKSCSTYFRSFIWTVSPVSCNRWSLLWPWPTKPYRKDSSSHKWWLWITPGTMFKNSHVLCSEWFCVSLLQQTAEPNKLPFKEILMFIFVCFHGCPKMAHQKGPLHDRRYQN